MVESGRPWSGEREACGEAESVTDVVVTASCTAADDEPEGDSPEMGNEGVEDRATLSLLVLDEPRRAKGTVIISQNWKRGGYPSQCRPLVRHLSQMGRLRSHLRHFLRHVPQAGSR